MLIDLLYYNPKFHLSLYKMATIVGKKDHTTIIHALKQTKNLIKVYPEFKKELIELHDKIYGGLDYYVHTK